MAEARSDQGALPRVPSAEGRAGPAVPPGRRPAPPAGGEAGLVELWLWRHPRAEGAAGRCIGRTDLAVDRRRAKRLAHRIRRTARREGLPRAIRTSPLRRCREVGSWLRRWGWALYVDPGLAEMDFGSWDGQPWSALAPEAFAAWEADFLHHPVGGGESLARVLERVRAFADATPAGPCLAVGHGGWINAARWLAEEAGAAGGTGAGDHEGRTPEAAHWPPAPPHASLTRLRWRR